MIGLGLLWDIADATAYFCSQRRARTQRIRVLAAEELIRQHVKACSVRCMPSCSYPKCLED